MYTKLEILKQREKSKIQKGKERMNERGREIAPAFCIWRASWRRREGGWLIGEMVNI